MALGIPLSEPKRSETKHPTTAPNHAWIASTAIMVQDRERSKSWYCEKLGLDLLDDHEHWVTAGRNGKGGAIHLCQVSEAGEGATLEPGNSGILIFVPGDLRRVHDDLARMGVRFAEDVTQRPWGPYYVVSDPDGNHLTLMAEQS